MSETSTNLGLPYLQAAQAQKHLTHNEALERLDLIVQLTVQAFGTTVPPLAPDEGQVWALGTGATGDWSGQDGTLAAWANGGWLFLTPREGWRASLGSELRVFDGGTWEIPDLPPLQNLPGVGIGTSYDGTNKLAVASAAVLFTHAGAGHQVKLNKAAAGDTASLLYQTGFSGRAEMGLAGSDDWSLKVSLDGTAWTTALGANATSGLVSLPQGISVAGPVTLPAGSVARAALADGAARSVIGRSASTTGAVADIAAASDHQVLRRSGSALGFGAVALNQSAAVTGQLALANGGTGANTAATARSNLGLGTAATAALTDTPTDTTAGRVLVVGAGHQQLDATLYRRGNLLGAVSQTAGQPTGAVIERGSNANGEFVRLADGTQICTLYLGDGDSGLTFADRTEAAITARFAGHTWTYPAAFASQPVTGCAFRPSAGTNIRLFGSWTVNACSTTSVQFRLWALPMDTDNARSVGFIAVGRWF